MGRGRLALPPYFGRCHKATLTPGTNMPGPRYRWVPSTPTERYGWQLKGDLRVTSGSARTCRRLSVPYRFQIYIKITQTANFDNTNEPFNVR